MTYFPNEIFKNILAYCGDDDEVKRQKFTKELIKDIDMYSFIKDQLEECMGEPYTHAYDEDGMEQQYGTLEITEDLTWYEKAERVENGSDFWSAVVQSEFHEAYQGLFTKFKFIKPRNIEKVYFYYYKSSKNILKDKIRILKPYIKMTENEIDELWNELRIN